MLVTEQTKVPRQSQPFLQRPEAAPPISAEAEMIISAIEAGQHGRHERRSVSRAIYRVQASLRLFSDLADTAPWTLFIRDANARGLGFITQHRLPLGYGGVLEIVVPDGFSRLIPCTLLRCRQAAPTWYEGALYFNRQQPDFLV